MRRSVRGGWARGGWMVLAVSSVLIAGACVPDPPTPGGDTTPPVLTVPGAIVVASTSEDGGQVTWDVEASDDIDGPLPVTCSHVPGLFPVGDTTVTCSATDAAGNSSSGSFVVTVGAWSPPGPTDSVTIGDETVTVTVPDGLVVSVDAAAPGSAPPAPEGIEFPFGPISIVVDGAVPGSIVPVVVTLESPVDVVRKLIDGAWDPFSYDGSTGATLSAGGTSIELRLRDGGRGDADGVADGRIVDPIGPGNATSLVITSDEMPVLTLNQPSEIQLETAGAEGPVVWSFTGGVLPHGLTLGADGLISGTPVSPGGSYARVQADDGVNVVTKLIMVLALGDPAGPPLLTGAALPDGERIALSYWLGGLGHVLADGSYQAQTSMTIGQARGFHGTSANVATSLTLLVTLGDAGYTYEVVDAATGAPVELEDPIASGGWASLSPTGEWLASVAPGEGVVRLIDTATFATQRTVPVSGCCLRWSADGDELVLGTSYTGAGTELSIVSPGDPSADRTITVPDEYCGAIADWSSTDRIALSCTAQLVTVSAVDGSDVRVLAQTSCPGGGSPCVSYDESGGSLRFSPSGSHIVTVERVDPSDPWNSSAPSRLVVLDDVDSASVTPLTAATYPGPGLIGWT